MSKIIKITKVVKRFNLSQDLISKSNTTEKVINKLKGVLLEIKFINKKIRIERGIKKIKIWKTEAWLKELGGSVPKIRYPKVISEINNSNNLINKSDYCKLYILQCKLYRGGE